MDESDIVLTWLCDRWDDITGEEPQKARVNDDQILLATNNWWDRPDFKDTSIDGVDLPQLRRLVQLAKAMCPSVMAPDEYIMALKRIYVWTQHWSLRYTTLPFPDFRYGRLDDLRDQGILRPSHTNLHSTEESSYEYYREYDHGNDIVIAPQEPGPSHFTSHQSDMTPEVDLPEYLREQFGAFENNTRFAEWARGAKSTYPTHPPGETDEWLVTTWMAATMRYLSQYSPEKMANSLDSQMRKYLSTEALEKEMVVRASFCMGEHSVEVFDLDVVMDKTGPKSWLGPRGEIDTERGGLKMRTRKYF